MITAGKLRRAKEKAVGGKRDRCRKGKSCSATCISGWKACLVEMAAPVSEFLGRAKKNIQRKAEQVLPGKRGKYLEGRREKFIRARGRIIKRVKRADLKGDESKGLELRLKLNRLERDIGSKLKVPSVGGVSTDATSARRAKYNEFKTSLVSELKRLALSGKKGSYEKIEERLMRLQSKAGGKFGDKSIIEKGKIWKDLKERRFVTRQESFIKAKDKLSNALRKAAEAGDLDKYRKIEDALLKLQGGKTSRELGLKVQINKGEFWRKYGAQNVKDELKAKDSVRSFLASRGKEREGVPKLSKLSTSEEFKEKLSKTDGLYDKRIKNAHSWVKNLYRSLTSTGDDKFSKSIQGMFFQGLLKSLENGMGGVDNLRSALSAISLFTGSEYSKIRNAQMLRTNSKEYRDKGAAIDKILSRGELIKPHIEKFRGKAVGTEDLRGMIESASRGGTFSGKAVSSWSSDLSVGQRFSDSVDRDRPERVILRAINREGVPIGNTSFYNSEYEILTPSYANYRYLGYHAIKALDSNGREHTYHMFDLEELPHKE